MNGDYKTHINRLLEDNIIETDYDYTIGKKSLGYRLKKHIRLLPKHRKHIMNKKIKALLYKEHTKLYRNPLHKWLIQNVKKIDINLDYDFVSTIAKQSVEDNITKKRKKKKSRADLVFADFMRIYTDMIHAVDSGDWYFAKGENSNRFFSNLTGMKRELRQLLRVDGKSLCEIDLANSQPLLLGGVMRKKGIKGIEKYLDLCETGQIYDYCAAALGISRNKIKIQFLTAMYGKNAFEFALKSFLEREFPSVARYIHNQKAKGVNLAVEMQKAESKLFINKISKRIMEERPDMFAATIHDSILCKPEDEDYVLNIIKNEFENITPTIKVKYHKEKTMYNKNNITTEERQCLLEMLEENKNV